MWRMSQDNWGQWADVVRIANQAAPILKYTVPGHYNDLDMMVSLDPTSALSEYGADQNLDPCQRCSYSC
jgi:alpha-galactosidase